MSNFLNYTSTKDFLYLIAININDSRTWCRFSQTCKKANKICKKLLKSKIIKTSDWRCKFEITSFLPNGHKHGLAKRYNTEECKGRPINEFYYKDNRKAIFSTSFWSELGTV